MVIQSCRMTQSNESLERLRQLHSTESPKRYHSAYVLLILLCQEKKGLINLIISVSKNMQSNNHQYLTLDPQPEKVIDPWPLRAKGLIVLVPPNQSDRKGNNKVSKCKLKKYLFGEKNERKIGEFRNSMTIAITPLVAQPIKMKDLHQSTSQVILKGVSKELQHPQTWNMSVDAAYV